MTKDTKKKAKTKPTAPQKTDKKELSELEKNALDIWWERKKERVGPPKFKKIKDRTVTHKEQDPDKFWPQVLETTGSTDIDFLKIIMSQIDSTLSIKDSEEVANFTTALMHGLNPKDETEGILMAQMTGTHNVSMEYLRRAAISGQGLEAANVYANRAYKLMNLFLKQLEILMKYRGKAAQQKVTVEHVHIHEGGQAVVGHIESKPRGEGENGKK